ncbi:MAG: type II toxin-antitoxin system VapC family toxin [Pirellulales bacterium]|jgi:predicted nucleic acid-binding protein
MIVLDASAALELVLRAAQQPRLLARVLTASEPIIAPHLVDLEVAHVLRRFVAARELTAPRAEQALVDFSSFRITRYAHRPYLRRIWELRGNCTAYDAAYLVLAEATGAPLVTCDRRLSRIPGHEARVECFAC